MKKENKFKAAIIGCGRIGIEEKIYNKKVRPGSHAGSYIINEKIDLVALCDPDDQRLAIAKKSYPRVKLYFSVEKMVEENILDIISIASPTKYHHQNVLQAAKGKPKVILCEKPIAYSLKEAEEIIDVCKKNNIQLFINHQRRFDPILQNWSRKIRAGFLGEILQGSAYYYNGLFNSGTHLVDLLRMFLGEPEWVWGIYNKKTSWVENDPNIDGLIAFGGEVIISLQPLSKNYGYFGFSIFGENGMLNVVNGAFEIQYRKKIKDKNYKGFFKLSPKIFKEGQPRSFFRNNIAHIVSYLEKKAKPASTGEDGIKDLAILLALKSSADNGSEKIYLKNKI